MQATQYMSVQSNLSHLLKDVSFVQSLDVHDLEDILKYASDVYYNTGQTVMPDALFDDLKDILTVNYPHADFLTKVGAPVVRNRVQLPFGLYSLDKVKPGSKDLGKWQAKFHPPFCLSDKLDGTSCLIVYTLVRDHWKVSLMTRGDGIIGGDISHLIDYIIPSKLQKQPPASFRGSTLAIRGEIIMSREAFLEVGGDMANARSLTNALVNRKKIDPLVANKTDFVVYEMVAPRHNKTEQMKFLELSGFPVVKHSFVDQISDALLSKTLDMRRTASAYEIDGLVVESNGPYDHKTIGNPTFAFAFKKPVDAGTHVHVIEVGWQVSKDGLLKPRVQYEPIKTDGVVMQYATAHNAKFVFDNKIGPGAVIEVIRSGSVIPTIVSVVEPATAQMPAVPFTWTKSGVDAVVKDVDVNEEVQIRRLIKFFSEMGVDNISKGLVNKFWDHGFQTLNDYLHATIDDLMELPGVERQLATKLHTNIQGAIKGAPLVKVMKASNSFSGGLGERKLTAILSALPNLLTLSGSKHAKMQVLIGIDGIQETTASQVLIGIDRFKQFMNDHHAITIKAASAVRPSASSQAMAGTHVVFSGVRDKDLAARVEAMGGIVNTSVSAKTTILVVKDVTATTSKIERAKELGIKVMDLSDFVHHVEEAS